jgi:hypothetical protein
MGRPVNKRFFGSFEGTNRGIKLSARKDNVSRDSFILLQKGTAKYNVKNETDGVFRVRLVNEITAANQAKMVGFEALSIDSEGVYTVDNTEIPIRKLTARRATAFNGTVYKWELVDDDSNDYIVLIPFNI